MPVSMPGSQGANDCVVRFLRVAALANATPVNFTNIANDAQVLCTTVYERAVQTRSWTRQQYDSDDRGGNLDARGRVGDRWRTPSAVERLVNAVPAQSPMQWRLHRPTP